MINGVAHGPLPGTTVCQLHMRHFKDGDELYLEPWRARAFPVVKDLAVNRGGSRSHHRRRGIHLRPDRQRSRRQCDSGAEGECRPGDGCGRLHRMRRLRGRMSECRGGAVHGRQDLASWLAAAGPAGTRAARAGDGGADERTRCSATARISANAKRSARSRFSSK